MWENLYKKRRIKKASACQRLRENRRGVAVKGLDSFESVALSSSKLPFLFHPHVSFSPYVLANAIVRSLYNPEIHFVATGLNQG
jgi:hypothetical protein